VVSLKDPAKLDGSYRNITPDTTAYKDASLWGLFNLNVRNGDFRSYYKTAVVELEVKTKHHILARLIIDEKPVKEMMLKGVIRHHYFFIRRKIHYLGLQFLYVDFDNYKYRLGMGPDGILHVDMVHEQFGWLVFMAAGHTERESFSFTKTR
jgi:hypothetical protein